MLEPGSTIGILGGGQLGRMLAASAAQLGYRCIGYAPEGDNVSAPLCADFVTDGWDSRNGLAEFSNRCDAVTFEFENVPLAALECMPAERLFPPRRALEVAQDRLEEKRFLADLGGRTAPFRAVDTRADLAAAVEHIGAPGILKTRRDGYDGKGQWRIESEREVEALAMPSRPTIYEGFVRFECEFSVLLVRGQDGEVRFWESPRNEHHDGILARSTVPAGDIVAAQVDTARDLARAIADRLGYVGVLACEFFATPDGPVFNEMAPRVHNSGHWTIEGAATSQFENHIRAVAGLPLGDTRTVATKVVMENLIGEAANTAHGVLGETDAHLHLYGKRKVREGRKMGHVTRLDR